MVQIGLITARNLLDGAAPPRIGHESDVRVTRDEHDLPRALTIFNISGDYILGSAQVPIEQWGDVFGVQLDKLTELRHVDCEPDQDGEVTAGERQRG